MVYVWWCALTGRRDGWLRAAVAALVTEGVLVTANRRDCPLGGLHDRLGDPVPLFELVLSLSTARRAVPVLGAVTAAGIRLLVPRPSADVTDASLDPTSSALLLEAQPGARLSRSWVICVVGQLRRCGRSRRSGWCGGVCVGPDRLDSEQS